MRFDKKILNNLSKKYATLAIGAASILGACNKGDDPIERQDVDVKFNIVLENGASSIHPDSLRALAARPDVANIYLVPEYDFCGLGPNGANAITNELLKPAINSVPGRVFGRGDIVTQWGVLNPTDSIWITQQNWTVNQTKQR